MEGRLARCAATSHKCCAASSFIKRTTPQEVRQDRAKSGSRPSPPGTLDPQQPSTSTTFALAVLLPPPPPYPSIRSPPDINSILSLHTRPPDRRINIVPAMPASSPHDKPSSSTSPRPFKGSVGPVSPGSSLSRSFNPNDPDQRERQMAQDLESAMAICEWPAQRWKERPRGSRCTRGSARATPIFRQTGLHLSA